ncbi:MAG TPA: DUF308 domain-containing protein [Candidatus Limnocylindrales bacterium]|nr:DUF308 domain-containing protein [Candidatus Limnocylindrales bacterium]
MPTETVNKVLPWKSGVPAWIMAVEGAIIAGIGLFVINQQEGAVRAVLIALGALMLFNGVPRLIRHYGAAADNTDKDMIQGWYGTVVGIAAILLTLIVQPENLSTIAILFGIALIIAGALELYERFTANKDNRRLMMFVMPLILLVAGVVLVAIPISDRITPETFGQILALLGFALLALGLVRMWGNYQRREALKEAEAKRAQLAKEIAEADKRAGATEPAPVTPAPASVSPVTPAPAPANVPLAAAVPAVEPPPAGDEPVDPAVSAAVEP